jgi:lauroyl/myristoyl acyltransferase
MLLRIALHAADLLARSLPAPIAYALAGLAGEIWFRSARGRRRLVAANLARVSAATGRPTSGRRFRRLVRSAFINHARYYMELLRAPGYRVDRIARHVSVDDWERHAATFRSGPTVVVSAHLGNFEPFGTFFAAHGFEAVAPVEEIEPRELFEFMAARRGAGRGVRLIPHRGARRELLAVLRRGGIAALIADRDLSRTGVAVSFFGHPASMPTGPASLVAVTGATFVTVRCLRVGWDRFRGQAATLEWTPSGDRRRDIEELTKAMVTRFEKDIDIAPEQWWGAFQPIWSDLAGPRGLRRCERRRRERRVRAR